MKKKKRYTTETLMQAIHELVVAEGCFAEAESILESHGTHFYSDVHQFTNYAFDVIAYIQFSTNEPKTYLTVDAFGDMDGSGEKKTWPMGYYRVLSDDLETAQILGKLGGSITYYAGEFINSHLDDFEPDKEA